jgi:hypothetical protein
MKRDAAQTIFRTVVFAGAMLGTAACGKKPAPQTPQNTQQQQQAQPADQTAKPDGTNANDPCAGGERPRGTDDDGGGGTGRGFVLS